MFISEERIRRIVIEELIDVLNEANPYHDADTGRLASSATGNVYSISKPASQRYGNEAAKGIVTAKGKLKAKYGMPDMCGRRTIDGKDISPVFSCSNFKKKYSELKKESKEIGTSDIQDVSLSDDGTICLDIKDILSMMDSKSITEQVSPELDVKCKAAGYQTFQDLLKAIDAAVKAANGEYVQTKK
jgi:hypothetical protein